jgi:hypothetical protein
VSFPKVAAPAVRAAASDRLPLSTQQQLWCAMEQSGAFGPRFIVTKALRITGLIDVSALQAALDDVVARHEMLRTVVVREAEPPFQQVQPPSPVPLEVRDLPPATDRTRDELAEDQLAEAELSSVYIDELPLLRAVLARFDDRDSVLSLVTHHTVCDGWSLHLIVRDLAAFYAARTGERPLTLPAPLQYRDYTQWQLNSLTGPEATENVAYWRKQLGDAEVFTLPTDRPAQAVHTTPYSSYNIVVPAEVTAAIGQLAKSVRCSGFMVVLAAFNVLAHRISGTLQPMVNTIVHGRGQPQFNDTVGPFLNFLLMRTDLASCTSFRDLIRSTRNTCLEAYAHELPIQHLEQEVPSAMAPLADPANCDLVFGYFESPFAGAADGERLREVFRIAESSVTVIRTERVSEQLPGGAAWSMGALPTGEIRGGLQFNPEEFDESTAVDWVSDYDRILRAAVAEPDRDWTTL